MWGNVGSEENSSATSLQNHVQYSTSVHTQGRMGRISSNGVEWRGTELGDEITMATRTSAAWSMRGMWEGVSSWSGLKWRESLFTFTVLGDSHGRGPNTHTNELFTRSHIFTHTRAHTRHYITDNNTYITRPCGHWGDYNKLASASASQNKYTYKFMFPDGSDTKPKKKM